MDNSNYIFVYGSLMGSIQSGIAKKLHAGAEFVGEGYVQGQLFDLGQYPGLIIWEGDSWVKGHVFQMADPAALIPFLDAYEDINWGQPDLSEYWRAMVEVKVADAYFDCWAYLYNQPTDQLSLIPDGDYLAYMKNNDAHRDFLNSLRAN